MYNNTTKTQTQYEETQEKNEHSEKQLRSQNSTLYNADRADRDVQQHQ